MATTHCLVWTRHIVLCEHDALSCVDTTCPTQNNYLPPTPPTMTSFTVDSESNSDREQGSRSDSESLPKSSSSRRSKGSWEEQTLDLKKWHKTWATSSSDSGQATPNSTPASRFSSNDTDPLSDGSLPRRSPPSFSPSLHASGQVTPISVPANVHSSGKDASRFSSNDSDPLSDRSLPFVPANVHSGGQDASRFSSNDSDPPSDTKPGRFQMYSSHQNNRYGS